MTGQELDAALAELGLRHDAPVTRALLGITGRSIRYYLSGQKPIPAPVSNLVQTLVWLNRQGVKPLGVALGVSRGLPLEAPPRVG